MGQGESGTMKSGVRETGSILQKEKKMRVDEGEKSSRWWDLFRGREMESGDYTRKGSGTLEVLSRFGLGRCAVEVLGPGRGEAFWR